MSGSGHRVRVLNINKAVGWASSGVEYAQKYRRSLLAGLPDVEDLYVFTDYIGINLTVLTDRLGFTRDQVVWIYHLLTGRSAVPSTLTVPEVLAMLGPAAGAPRELSDCLEVAVEGSPVRYRIRTFDDGTVDRVETTMGNQLIRAEHYDDSLHNVEHFHENRLARRAFYTRDGEVAAEQTYRDGEILRTVITPASPLGAAVGPVVLDGRSRFFQHVFAHLLSEPDDVVIVDRALDVIDAVYPVLGDHRLYSVVHAEHVDRRQLDDGVLLWNNHYEHVFTRPDLVNGLIVSTSRQQEVLRAQLPVPVPVIRIPVGVASPPPSVTDYDPLALVTASRLADEKHLDLLVRAVAKARESLPGVHLDIYGEGNRDPVLAAIKETGSEEYVQLKGHQQLEGVLAGYALYVSASTSEGFGLSLLEAISEGLPIVGFDVDYGNREMVDDGVNGRLVPSTGGESDVDRLATAVVDVLSSGTLDAMREASLRKAAQYAPDKVRALWADLLRGEPEC